MARTIGRLTVLRAGRLKEPGMYPDGGGLYLQIGSGAAKSWVFRFTSPTQVYPPFDRDGRPHKRAAQRQKRYFGLGSFDAVSLAAARAKAGECRSLLDRGIDPIEARAVIEAQAKFEAAKATSFKDAAAAYIEAHKVGWRNAKHIQQWQNTLKTYAEPVIGLLAVQDIDTGLVVKVLSPIWKTKPETASRLRGRIEAVLDWATANGLRKGDNPARWRGHLAKLLPPRAKLRAVRHHPALPYGELPGFMAELRAEEGIAARALEFTVLTVARTGETVGAQPDEIDRKHKVWTVPAERMKAKREHRVPLSAAALAVIDRLSGMSTEFVFPGHKRGKHLSNMAMLALLERMERADLTVQGFRSTFRDWAAERTNYPREVVEMALAHTISDKVEAAYRRGDLLDKRRRLMDDWARYCAAPTKAASGKVVAISRGR